MSADQPPRTTGPAVDRYGRPGAVGTCPTCDGTGVAFRPLVPDHHLPGSDVTNPDDPHVFVPWGDGSTDIDRCLLDGRSVDDVVHEPGWPSATAGQTRAERRAQAATDRAAARAPRHDHPNPARPTPWDRAATEHLQGLRPPQAHDGDPRDPLGPPGRTR